MQRRTNRRTDPYLLLLLWQLGQQVVSLERKPPVTVGIMGACAVLFFERAWGLLPASVSRHIPSIAQGCMIPAAVVQGRQWSRILWSTLLHADEAHLYFNMGSLLYKGIQLELGPLGSLGFAALVAELLVLSQALYVGGAAVLASHIPEYRYLYARTCAVGFSGVLFALKVVVNWGSPGFSSVMGVQLPTKYLCWAELILASLVNPQASFAGHLAGILAGLAHVLYIRPALSWLAELRRAGARRTPRRRAIRTEPQFAAAAASATPPPSTRPPAEGSGVPVWAASEGGARAAAAAGSASAGSAAASSTAAAVSQEEMRQRRLARFASVGGRR